MSIRSQVSAWLASGLQKAHHRRLVEGDYWAFPFSVWTRFPRPVQKWCSYRVFGPSEEYARDLVRKHEILGTLHNHDESSWSLSASTLLFLWQRLLERRPSQIVEFGQRVEHTHLRELCTAGRTKFGDANRNKYEPAGCVKHCLPDSCPNIFHRTRRILACSNTLAARAKRAAFLREPRTTPLSKNSRSWDNPESPTLSLTASSNRRQNMASTSV